ncbi:tyrosine-protein phosphatase [Bifidobacterium xylocopae]|uniref:Protein tyrosine phosphatase n=1 Tax=Bifidobacterium xylocopae TaxID=2493119 RepID=A0A366KCA4_9BIFI|nr:tyrosine-protein phosphatase [Bifidobacterium xylocopae]RBP99376.1 hypothetical protein CRD59_04040 [Bifidobacterium xylocopae]
MTTMNITNFRDLGGVRNIHGQEVRTRQVMRSGHLVDLDQTTMDALENDYHLSLIIDFRRPFEIQEQPDDEVPGATMINIDLLGLIGAADMSLDDFASIGKASKVSDHLMGTYRSLVLDPGAQQGFGRFLNLVLDNDSGSTIFHCFVGKDRTGFGAALLYWLLEVDDDVIMTDYLKTNQERVKANDELVERFRAKGFDQDSLDALSQALYVKREYLEHAEKLMRDEYGDVFAYADQALDFGPEKVEALRAKLLTS